MEINMNMIKAQSSSTEPKGNILISENNYLILALQSLCPSLLPINPSNPDPSLFVLLKKTESIKVFVDSNICSAGHLALLEDIVEKVGNAEIAWLQTDRVPPPPLKNIYKIIEMNQDIDAFKKVIHSRKIRDNHSTDTSYTLTRSEVKLLPFFLKKSRSEQLPEQFRYKEKNFLSHRANIVNKTGLGSFAFLQTLYTRNGEAFLRMYLAD